MGVRHIVDPKLQAVTQGDREDNLKKTYKSSTWHSDLANLFVTLLPPHESPSRGFVGSLPSWSATGLVTQAWEE